MKTIYLISIVSLLFILCLNQQGIAQNEELRFEHIGVEDGLSNEKVTAILQDSKGYIWFGTFDGLNKYDGYTFTKYKFDPLDSNSLSQNWIYTLFEDNHGTIWLSTFEGLCKFDRANEKFTRYKPSPKARFSNPNIGVINEDRDGMIWVGSFTGGLCRFNPETGKFLPEYIDLASGHLDGIFCIYKDRAGELWVGNNTGLHHIQLTAARAGQLSGYNITHYQNDPLNTNSISGNIVYSIFEDKAGVLWVGTNSGLNSLVRKTGIFTRYKNDPKNIHSISGNNSQSLGGHGIKEDEHGNLWIITDKGLNKLNKDRSVFTAYYHNPKDPASISTNNINVLEIDNAGILWAGLWDGKLNKVNLNDKGFGLRHNDPDNINSLNSNEVTSIVEDSSGIIWIGTNTRGLNCWNRKTNQFTHFRNNPGNDRTLRYDVVQAIWLDRQGYLWVCNGDVLSLFNKQTGGFTHFKSNETTYDEERHTLISITEDREGMLWLGTLANGIISFDKKTRQFQHYYYSETDSSGISDFTAIAIFADSKDNIWIGHGSIGTDKYSKVTRQFTHYRHNARDTASISSNIVNCFYEDSKGNLWLGTWAGGISCFDYKNEKFTTFTDKHGLSDNTIYSILEDNQNHIWLGTLNGLSRFDLATKTFTNYDYKDGLQSNIFAAGLRNRGANCKGRDGTMYFGGNNGFNFFDPLQIKSNSSIAPVVITQFKLFDQLIKGVHESKEIVLDYDNNYFSFEFSSLSFHNPAKNQYAYKLEGVDKDWVYSGSRRYASYTNISPGIYTFKVKGTNSDGIWNENGASISIIVKPPWWLTWWAYVIYAVGFVLMIWMLTAYRSRHLKAENILLEQKVNKRTDELKQSLEEKFELSKKIESQQALLNERLRISRELHDDIGSTLGSISIYSEVAKKRNENNKNTIEVLSKIGIASREIIDKMSDIVWSLNPDNENFEQLHSRIITFAAMMLTPQNIRYKLIADERLKELQLTGVQIKNIFLIFKEALHNIVKYASCKTVNITLCVKNKFLIMTIEDDGNGFDADVTHLSNRFIHSSTLGMPGGAGIKNMFARTNDIHAELCINSKINGGTIVQLTIPI